MRKREVIQQGRSLSVYLAPNEVLVIDPSGVGTYKIERYSDPSQVVENINDSSYKVLGPYKSGTGMRITSLSSSITVSIFDADNKLVLSDVSSKEDPFLLKNSLIKEYPTLVAYPYNTQDAVIYDAAAGTVSIDTNVTDPASGLAMAKVNVAAGATSGQNIDWIDINDPFTMNGNDVWMLSVFIPERVSDLTISILYTDASSFTGGNFRRIDLTGRMLSRGYNLIPILHNEVPIDASTYGKVGTHYQNAWVDGGTQNVSTTINSIRVLVKFDVAQAADTPIYIGSVWRARAGWAKSAVMLYADDVQSSWADLAGPIIESYGWKYTLAIVANYSVLPASGGHETAADIRKIISRGHEIHNHTRSHHDMSTGDTATKTREIEASRKYWAAQGVQSAVDFMAWPFGNYDDESIGILKAQGVKVALTTLGDEINPVTVGVNPYLTNRFGFGSQDNSWQIDSMLNGTILRGASMVAFGHGVLPGGEGLDDQPAQSTRAYEAHIRRWCELLAEHEAAGRCVVTTPSRFYKMSGIDVKTHEFLEVTA